MSRTARAVDKAEQLQTSQPMTDKSPQVADVSTSCVSMRSKKI